MKSAYIAIPKTEEVSAQSPTGFNSYLIKSVPKNSSAVVSKPIQLAIFTVRLSKWVPNSVAISMDTGNLYLKLERSNKHSKLECSHKSMFCEPLSQQDSMASKLAFISSDESYLLGGKPSHLLSMLCEIHELLD